MESIKVEVKSCADTAIVQHSTIKNEVPNENKNVEDTACDTNIQVAQKGNFWSGTNAIQVDDNYTATNPKQSQSKPRKSEIIDDNSINRSRSRSRREGDHESRPLSALDIQNHWLLYQSVGYYLRTLTIVLIRRLSCYNKFLNLFVSNRNRRMTKNSRDRQNGRTGATVISIRRPISRSVGRYHNPSAGAAVIKFLRL